MKQTMNLSHAIIHNIEYSSNELKWELKISYEGEIICIVKQDGRGGCNQYFAINNLVWKQISSLVISKTINVLPAIEHMDLVLACCEEGYSLEQGIQIAKQIHWLNA